MCKKSHLFFSLTVYFFVFIFTANTVSAFVFTSNLKLGDTGPDVFLLQKALNEDASTAVSLDGPGSKGNETYYFGEKTQQAVIAFQNKYASEILTPLGLFSGTGFVGASTRIKLNNTTLPPNTNILPNTSIPSDLPIQTPFILQSFSTTEPFVAGIDGNGDKYGPAFANFQNLIASGVAAPFPESLQISSISNNSGKYGDTISIMGAGFSMENNTISLGAYKILNTPATSKNKIVFTVPQYIPFGVYDLQVGNTGGTTKSTQYFVVTDSSLPAPKVLSVQPVQAFIGDEIVVYGENFTSTGNQVRSSLGVVSGIPSADGKTIKFTLKAPESVSGFESVFDNNFELKVLFYVVNSHGVSDRNNPAIITLRK